MSRTTRRTAVSLCAQAKDGKVDAVKAELEAYKESLSANDLYAEFADKVALAKDAPHCDQRQLSLPSSLPVSQPRLRPHRYRAGDCAELLIDPCTLQAAAVRQRPFLLTMKFTERKGVRHGF